MLHVYAAHRLTYQLQTVEQTAEAPCPLTIGTVLLEFGIQAVKLIRATVMFLPPLRIVVHLILMEDHRGDAALFQQVLGQRDIARANHQRIRSLSRLRIADGGREMQRLSVHGDIHQERIPVHTGFHLFLVHRGLPSYLIGLNIGADLIAPFLPLLQVLHASLTVVPHQGIAQLLLGNQLLVGSHALRIASGILLIKH